MWRATHVKLTLSTWPVTQWASHPRVNTGDKMAKVCSSSALRVVCSSQPQKHPQMKSIVTTVFYFRTQIYLYIYMCVWSEMEQKLPSQSCSHVNHRHLWLHRAPFQGHIKGLLVVRQTWVASPLACKEQAKKLASGLVRLANLAKLHALFWCVIMV